MDILDIYLESQTHKLINSDIKSNMLSHSYLIVSKDEQLISSLALYIAKEINCMENEKPCDKCSNCQKINHSNMVDVISIPNENRGIVVEDINNLISDCYIRPVESEYKIYILNNFNNATTQAQNKLLKTLEEPPNNVIFILTCTNINQVLPTIRSRSKKIIENELNIDTLSKYLQSIGLSDYEIISMLSQGSLTNAMKINSDGNAKEIIKLCFDILENLKTSSDILRYSSEVLLYKKEMEFFLNTLIVVLRDIVVYRSSKDMITFKSFIRNYENLSNIYSNKMIDRIVGNIAIAFNKLEFNCNPSGIIDQILLNIVEVKFLCQK